MDKILYIIRSPKDIKGLTVEQLNRLAAEIREFLIDSVSRTGGHIGANLGVVELTIALHAVFDEEDKLIFDTGHQGYTHKLLTGRKQMFETLNKFDGMSRFLCREESQCDIIDASHAGTAISIATGIAQGKKLSGEHGRAIAFVGDGALVEGMSFEGLNFGTAKEIPLLIVINDNGMAIPPNVGGIKNLFSGNEWESKSRFFFEGLGYGYYAVRDGHDLKELVDVFQSVKNSKIKNSIVVHVKTEKGKGLPIAKDHKYKMHFSMPFNPITGEGTSPTPVGRTYATVAGDKLYKILKNDEKVVIITPSTPYASGLDNCLEDFPDRTIDVGMAEQQAAGMAVGLSIQGYKPFVCYQSTFMQRAFDQLIHDIAFMNLPVTILAVRSGFSGYDSPTAHGIYDFTYLRAVPNLSIFYPSGSYDLENIIEMRKNNSNGPMVILYPYDPVSNYDELFMSKESIDYPQIIFESDNAYIITTGNCLDYALEARKLLQHDGVEIGIISIRWIRPFPKEWIMEKMNNINKLVSLEESIISGGIGSMISEIITDKNMPIDLLRVAIPDSFVKAGNKDELSRIAGIDSSSIYMEIKERWSL